MLKVPGVKGEAGTVRALKTGERMARVRVGAVGSER